jgi:hypothetical protein
MGSFLTQWYVTINPTRTSFSQPVPTSASLVFVLGNPLKANSKDYYHTCLSCTALHCDHRLTGTRRKIKRYALLFFSLDILIFYIFFSSKPSFSEIQNPKKAFAGKHKIPFSRYRFFRYIAEPNQGKPCSSFPFFSKTKEQREQRADWGKKKEIIISNSKRRRRLLPLRKER